MLCLRGISTGDFQKAILALLGEHAPNLSASVISGPESVVAGRITTAGTGAISQRGTS